MAKYQGHRNWNHWNVALWIANDEPMYRLALRLKREHGSEHGAELFLEGLRRDGQYKTPDGAPYTYTPVLAAIRGLES